ncbi:hypothetical protein RJ640_002477 [Escallonia rubra]|uniref:DUF4219 domain-containing protein n=1 Tax=Escallonia rubra TaxID=112253 RepID=A0AA88RBH2_9ASTE|nr:hypothetical protein RJ640_002477 [Escallonia rubra]
MVVAIKVFKLHQERALRSFETECEKVKNKKNVDWVREKYSSVFLLSTSSSSSIVVKSISATIYLPYIVPTTNQSSTRAEVLMAATSGAYPFPKLVKDNYERWSIQMKTFLGGQDVWEAVKEEYVEPKNLAGACQAVKKVAKEALVKDQKTLSLIQLGVDDNIF